MKSCIREQILEGDDDVIDEILATLFKIMK